MQFVSEKMKKSFDKMSIIMSPSNNHNSYRKLLSTVNRREPCIPYFGQFSNGGLFSGLPRIQTSLNVLIRGVVSFSGWILYHGAILKSCTFWCDVCCWNCERKKISSCPWLFSVQNTQWRFGPSGWLRTELEITVRRQTFSDHFRPLSEQNLSEQLHSCRLLTFTLKFPLIIVLVDGVRH